MTTLWAAMTRAPSHWILCGMLKTYQYLPAGKGGTGAKLISATAHVAKHEQHSWRQLGSCKFTEALQNCLPNLRKRPLASLVSSLTSPKLHLVPFKSVLRVNYYMTGEGIFENDCLSLYSNHNIEFEKFSLCPRNSSESWSNVKSSLNWEKFFASSKLLCLWRIA